MGVKPYLAASSIQAIMAQRLIRILCKSCREVDPDPDKKMMSLVGIDADEGDGKVHRPVGCAQCGGVGYKGRKAIFELMMMNNECRELAFNRAAISEIRAAAIRSGMRSLLDDGRIKILRGDTTTEEIARFAQAEQLMTSNMDME